MEIVGVVFLIAVIGFTYAGIKLIKLALRRPAEPQIPPARTANTHGVDAAYSKAARVVTRTPRKIGRGLRFAAGVWLISAPWLFVYWVYSSFGLGDISGTKGRVLRVRSRAQLPEPARGSDWSGDPVTLRGTLTAPERRTLGELWLLTARMEHASVAAFSQLGIHLAALGAPAHLLEATHRAALDEIRHARACFAIVHAITGEPHSAGPIPALATASSHAIDFTRLAIGSLIDGCLAEGIAADVAARGASVAEEPTIRATLTMIARDEGGHAELAWDVLAWTLAAGGPAVARAVGARVAELGRELAPRMPNIPGLDAAALASYGLIDQDALGELARLRIAAVQARAQHMLDASEPLQIKAA